MLSGSFCQAAVGMFLFLSGYGIMCSYQQNGIKNYWKKRFRKIYIPFLIISTMEFFMKLWQYRNNIGDMYIKSTLLSLVGLYPNNTIDGTFWFITFILMQYFIFWIAFRFNLKKSIQWIVFTMASIGGYVIFKNKFIWVRENDIYGYCFYLGVLFVELKDKYVVKDGGAQILLVCICLLLYIVSLNECDIPLVWWLNGAVLIILEIIVIHTLSGKIHLKRNVLISVGKMSYELYLTEGVFFFHKILYDLAGYNYWGLIIHVMLICMISFALRQIEVTATKFLDGVMKDVK
jgi:hypothetical protein